MPDVFITMKEAAEFEGVKYGTFAQRIARNPKQYKTKTQPQEGGGKEQVLIAVSSLSPKGRKAWRAAQKVDGRDVVIEKRTESAPWYVGVDLNHYTEQNKKAFYEAVELAARVQDFIDYDGPDRTAYAERYALGLGVSLPTLYRYVENVLKASAWALKMEKEDGQNRDYFRALALCRKPREKASFPSLTDEQKALIQNIWFDRRFAANLGTIEMLYEKFEEVGQGRGWESYPSIKTVARYIKHLMDSRGGESARYLAANGSREWKNKKMLKGKRDATSLKVMEYVVGDEHTFDFWVQWVAPNGKVKAVRPKLVAWMDMRSRAIVGDVACVDANNQTLKESLVKMLYERIKGGYKQALRGRRKYTREAVKYDLFREKNNVDLWRELKSSKYTPGPYHFNVITEPKRRDLSIPQLRDKVVQLVIHEELQNMFRPVFINGSFACQYGRGPIRAAFKVQHDMRVARMKWGDNAAIIKIDARKFFYSIDRALLKKILAKRFKKLKKKRPETYEGLLRFYRLLCKVIDSSPEGETGIPLGNVSSQDFANIYLNELDQFCVRFLGAKLYTRYMDDIVIVAPDKETAREWLAKIKVFLRERLHLDTNKKTKVFYMRQGVNAYGFKIKATHMMLRTESKRREKRRVKAMVRKMKEGKLTRSAVVQAVNSWLGFARWACAYNLAKKIFAPYRFIKTEGAIPYGAISRNRQARRLLQQRRDLEAPYKAVAS